MKDMTDERYAEIQPACAVLACYLTDNYGNVVGGIAHWVDEMLKAVEDNKPGSKE